MKIRIKYLNGIRFKHFIINSAQRINQMEEYLFNSSEIMIVEASPALSVYIGIGGAAIAVLGDPQQS